MAGGETNLCQSVMRARVLKKLDSAKPIFLRVLDGNELIASLLVFHKIPFDRQRKRRLWNVESIFTGNFRGWLEWHDGPIFYSKNRAVQALSELLQWIDSYGMKKRLGTVANACMAHTSEFSASYQIKYVFEDNCYDASKWGTYLVDLWPDEETIWASLKQAARKSIKKAKRNDIIARKIDGIDDFRTCYYEPYLSVKNSAPSFETYRVVFDEDLDNLYSFYVVENLKGVTLGTLGMYMFNGVATEIMSALTPEAFEQKIPAQDLLHWEMILEAKRKGCHTFDLAGVNPNPQTPKEIGIRRFKEKWGGRYIEYYTYKKEMYPAYFLKLIKPAKNFVSSHYKRIKSKSHF